MGCLSLFEPLTVPDIFPVLSVAFFVETDLSPTDVSLKAVWSKISGPEKWPYFAVLPRKNKENARSVAEKHQKLLISAYFSFKGHLRLV